MTKFLSCALPLIGLACTSCASSNPLYPVSGSVTFNGKPAVGAAVFFRPQARATVRDPMMMGIVQDDGSFELVCGSRGKGAPPGEYDVLIEWKRATGPGKGRPRNSQDRLHGRYADPKHPRLHALVRAEANQLPPFELSAARKEGD